MFLLPARSERGAESGRYTVSESIADPRYGRYRSKGCHG